MFASIKYCPMAMSRLAIAKLSDSPADTPGGGANSINARPGRTTAEWGLTLPAMASTRQASGRTAAEPLKLHVRRPNLSLDDLLRFVVKPLHVTLGGLIGCLRRFQGGSCTLYLLLPAAKVSRLVFMPSCPQSLGGLALLLIRAPSFLHGGIHLRLRVAHTVEMERGAVSARGAKRAERRVQTQSWLRTGDRDAFTDPTPQTASAHRRPVGHCLGRAGSATLEHPPEFFEQR